MPQAEDVIDDMSRPAPGASNGARWHLISDAVMGGRSAGEMRRMQVAGHAAMRLRGEVSLQNNGGFLQMALDLSADGGPVDARGWGGIALDVFGNGAVYNLHLRTTDATRPWQSYRHSFEAPAQWRRVELPFAEFVAHRIDLPLRTDRLRRIGVVAIGREFEADIAVRALRFIA